MFAGVMMAAIHRVFGFMYFPDTPGKTKANYISEKEKQLAVARLPPIKEDGHNIHPVSLFKRVFANPVL
ncbi:hypothetical protein ACHAPS_007904 [Verticillium nonalfalfae]